MRPRLALRCAVLVLAVSRLLSEQTVDQLVCLKAEACSGGDSDGSLLLQTGVTPADLGGKTPAVQEETLREAVSRSERLPHWSQLATSILSLLGGSRPQQPYTSETRFEIGVEFAVVAIILAAVVSFVVPWQRALSSQPGAAEETVQGSGSLHCSETTLMTFAVLSVVITMFLCWYVEGWTVLDTCYFVAQIVTTVGYGDLTPKSEVMRLCTAFMILLALILVGRVLNNVTDRLEKMEGQALVSLMANVSGQSPGPEGGKSHGVSTLLSTSMPFAGFVLAGTLFYGLEQHCSCSYGMTRVPDCTDTEYHACVEAGGYVMSFLDAFYFSIVTLTTVGFGDFCMRSWVGRLFGIPWMILGVASTAHFVTGVSVYLTRSMRANRIEKKADEKYLRFLGKEDIDEPLSKAEHHLFMLLKNGTLSQEMMDKLQEHYEALEPDDDGLVFLASVARQRSVLLNSSTRDLVAP